MTYIKWGINYEKLAKNMKSGTEVSTIRVQLGKNKWVKLTNVYCRPERSDGDPDIKFEKSIIPSTPSTHDSIICGDFNVHSELWDHILKSDKRGEEIVDWTLENDLSILNDGSATRFDRSGKGNDSTPDISLCGQD